MLSLGILFAVKIEQALYTFMKMEMNNIRLGFEQCAVLKGS